MQVLNVLFETITLLVPTTSVQLLLLLPILTVSLQLQLLVSLTHSYCPTHTLLLPFALLMSHSH